MREMVTSATFGRKRKVSKAQRDFLLGMAFVLPWLVGFCLFRLYPILSSLYFSFTKYNILQPPRWIGLKNFVDIFKDPLFLMILKNTAVYVILAVPATIVLGFLLAHLLNKGMRLRSFLRSVFFLPSILQMAAMAILWNWILNPRYGLINGLLILLGFQAPQWTTSPLLVKPVLAIVTPWFSVGPVMVIFLAALLDVPREIYESAAIDGARPSQTLLRITIPMVSPVVLFMVLTELIDAIQSFTFPFLLTGGGPASASTFFAQYMFENAFQWFKMGYASALTWIMLLISTVLVAIILRTSNRWVHYGK